MTVTTSPRRSKFLQQARWDAVQKAKFEGMSIRKMTAMMSPGHFGSGLTRGLTV